MECNKQDAGAGTGRLSWVTYYEASFSHILYCFMFFSRLGTIFFSLSFGLFLLFVLFYILRMGTAYLSEEEWGEKPSSCTEYRCASRGKDM